ncbi:putative U3 small nucleolar RNA-associated protein 11 [Trichinella patagoniensis]|uniref:U3 small nucleolar RNA-associated protein 11 n=1 Tax=Trichinella patagoniensis TaxID=990121 RepID=A0A0V1A7L5_9BILA|nr:putative U3 small nucleolar RNA-associated protein 11 [Trichinella patagoniensis]
MSSLKNVDKSVSRVHRERSQLSSRRRLGELEKKKDYIKRARSHQIKENAIRKLRRKALEKNPDEFYFHMINSKVEDGVHYEKAIGKDENSKEQEKLLQTQNLNYINFKLQIQRQKIKKLLDDFGFLFSLCKVNSVKKHSKSEENEKVNSSKKFDLELLKKKFPSGLNFKKLQSELQSLDKSKLNSFQELLKRLRVEKELSIVAEKLHMKKEFAKSKSKGIIPRKKRKGTAIRAPVYKWQFERKR